MVSDDIKLQVTIISDATNLGITQSSITLLESSFMLLEETLLRVVIYNCNMFILFKPQESYWQHFLFFVTYEWAQKVRAFVPG